MDNKESFEAFAREYAVNDKRVKSELLPPQLTSEQRQRKQRVSRKGPRKVFSRKIRHASERRSHPCPWLASDRTYCP